MAKQTAREKAITNGILKALNELPNCKAIKRHGSAWSSAGEPDIEGCICGHHFEFEVKRPGCSPDPLQLKRIKEWREAGATCEVVHSKAEALAALGLGC